MTFVHTMFHSKKCLDDVMGRAQLKALLTSGTSIVFDARARELPANALSNGEPEKLPPFFEHALLRNVIVLKTIGRADPANGCEDGLQTRLYMPFNGSQIANGGMSLVCGSNFSVATLERVFGVDKIDPERIESDLKKIEILVKTPCLSPFLLRDAFERAGMRVDKHFFKISDAETEALRNNLKAKLKPLAAMALNVSATAVGNTSLDLLAAKLWELDDASFLKPLAGALKIPEPETIDVFYAWIGVGYFQHAFAKRQAELKELAKWLAAKPPFPEGTKEDLVREYEDDRKQVRACVRMAWTSAGEIFERFTASYNALIAAEGDPQPFVSYLKGVQADFNGLGADLTVVEQCLCFHAAVSDLDRAGTQSVDMLREIARTLRGAADVEAGRAAA
jgi:hypothetical protein